MQTGYGPNEVAREESVKFSTHPSVPEFAELKITGKGNVAYAEQLKPFSPFALFQILEHSDWSVLSTFASPRA